MSYDWQELEDMLVALALALLALGLIGTLAGYRGAGEGLVLGGGLCAMASLVPYILKHRGGSL